jgi:hypothetical protein
MRAKVGIVCIALLGLVCAAQASDSVLKPAASTSDVAPMVSMTRDNTDCPPDSLYSAPPHLPDEGWTLGVSDTDFPFLRYENFTGVTSPIQGLTWWGAEFDASIVNCTMDPLAFDIRFYEDNGGVVGAEVASFQGLSVARLSTNLFYHSTYQIEAFQYSVVLPSQVTIPGGTGWIAIQGVSATGCRFWWMSSETGNLHHCTSTSYADPIDCANPDADFNFAFCLQGQYVPVYGACCDDATGICENDVEQLDCVGRFLPDGTCADLDPACGYILGACCYPDGTCEYKTEVQCANLCGDLDGNGDVGFADYQMFVGAFGSCAGDPEFIAAADLDLNGCITLADYSLWVACYRNGGGLIGEWLGPNTNCDDCPCIVTCPPGASIEDEPCGEDLNGGCNMDPPNYMFGTIALDETICGTGWAEGGTRDTDWYELTLTEEAVVTIMVEAEFPALTFLIDAGSGDCSDYVIIGDGVSTTLECDPITLVSPCVPAGLYYVWVGPSLYEGYPCTLDYYVTVSADACPIGACCLTDGTCIPDVTEPACAAAGGWQWHEGLSCDDVVCPMIAAEDFCEDAVRILPGETLLGSTLNATIDTDFVDNACGTSLTAPGVWFLVAGTGNELTATTCGDFYDYDTKLHVWCECDGAEWSCVGGNDDNCSNGASSLLSTVTWCSAPGHEYLVLVSGYSSNIGLFELQIIEGAACDTPPACMPPIGACCADDGTCLGNLTENECMTAGGDWYIDADCVNGPFQCPGPCAEDTITIEIFTDNYPTETTWEVAEVGVGVIAQGGPYADSATLYSTDVCASATGCYIFTIFDSFGDGICCSYGDGYYNVLLNGTLLATGGDFDDFDTVLNIGNGCGDPLGACCAADGTCIGTITEADCNTAGGTWYADQDCASGAFTCPCSLECPAGSTPEGEACGEDLNGGCNYDVPPYLFGTITCGETICGTGWAGGGSRDTDWFELVIDQDSIITIEGSAEFDSLFFLIDPGPDPECSAAAIIDSVTADPCAIATYTSTCLPAGLYYVWAGPSVFEGWPCDLDYYVTVTCDPCAARPASAAQANVAVSAEVEHPSTAAIAAPVKK